jgi:FKBP-type peptidyl-prolyl cis-trans isomerase 2
VTLDEARQKIGQKVTYEARGKREEGVIKSVGEQYVFVRFNSHQDVGQGCRPEDLRWTRTTTR